MVDGECWHTIKPVFLSSHLLKSFSLIHWASFSKWVMITQLSTWHRSLDLEWQNCRFVKTCRSYSWATWRMERPISTCHWEKVQYDSVFSSQTKISQKLFLVQTDKKYLNVGTDINIHTVWKQTCSKMNPTRAPTRALGSKLMWIRICWIGLDGQARIIPQIGNLLFINQATHSWQIDAVCWCWIHQSEGQCLLMLS